jgi:hypothetical protein
VRAAAADFVVTSGWRLIEDYFIPLPPGFVDDLGDTNRMKTSGSG